MAVYQVSTLRIKPGRMEDFLKHQDEIKEINERYGLKSRRILRATLAGEDTGKVLIISEFDNLISHATWATERSKDPEYREWAKTTPGNNPEGPSTMLSSVLMTDITR